MNMQIEKMELIELIINTKTDSVLKKLRSVLEKSNQLNLSEAEYKIIDQRRENHLKSNSKSYTWKQVKENIQLAKNDL
jgi:hypothetical protein